MNADAVVIIVKTSTAGAKTTPIVIYPEEAGDIRTDVVQISGDSTAADNLELQFDGTGLTGGTYPATQNQVSNIACAGSGAITFTYTLTSTGDGSPIADADVWVTTDLAGTLTVASGVTDAFGQVIFYLDAGTYYLWRSKPGWDFTPQPDTEIVS